jgi:hypothetical protein
VLLKYGALIGFVIGGGVELTLLLMVLGDVEALDAVPVVDCGDAIN